jgi:alpha-D-ribose 1-methylphosphonate 5-triphosphate synthase subunit PhnL
MRILLQHARTGLYLRSPENWTANPFESLDFKNSQAAIDFAREHNIDGIQIAVTFMDSQFDEVVPLPPLPRTSPGPSG